MAARYLVITLLFIAAVLGPALVRSGDTPASPGPFTPVVPEEALRALEQGRYWRASRILGEYLAAVPDPEPASILLAAQANAGWGDWAGVERLLSGRGWLDTVAGGFGWNLLGRSRLALGRWAEGDIALSRYLEIATGAGDRDRGLAELRRGFALARDGKVSPALQTFDRAAELLPQLGDWIHVFAAQAAARAGDTATVRARLEATDPYLAREWAWRLLIDARAAAGDRDGAERAALAAVHELSSAGRRASAWVAVADLRLQRADTAGARTAYRRAMEASPGASAAVDAARKLSELPGLSATDRLRIGRLYLRHGNLTRGRAGLEAYLASGHGSEHEREQVRLELGRTYFREGRYAEAERLLLALAEETSSARIGAEAMYQAGRAQYRQGRTDAGRATFLRTAERFPNERAAAQAVFLVADLDHDDGRLDAAREYYRRAARIQPGINEAGLALMRLGGIAFAEGDYNEAATIFEEYRRLHPDGRRYQQATYWAAKSYFELGKDDLARARLREARRSDPFSWYGLRAADLLGEDLWDVPLDASPPRNPAVEAEVAGAFARLDLLREIGLDDIAAFEVERLKDHFLRTDGALYALAEAFNERGYTFTGIGIGWEIRRRERTWNRRLLRIIYPFPYRNLIVAEAAERGIDPFLVAGLIRQESMFEATIKSPAGAVGLMQIMPATGRALARDLAIGAFKVELLERPEINIHLGVAYIAGLLSRYGERLTSALAAYNAGPHRVARWSAFPEYADEELFAERIPYGETRDYVKIVQQNARLYAALYADDEPSATTAPAGP